MNKPIRWQETVPSEQSLVEWTREKSIQQVLMYNYKPNDSPAETEPEK